MKNQLNDLQTNRFRLDLDSEWRHKQKKIQAAWSAEKSEELADDVNSYEKNRICRLSA
jgi:hypothetical protein